MEYCSQSEQWEYYFFAQGLFGWQIILEKLKLLYRITSYNVCYTKLLRDGATMSAKKDAMVNIGGFLAINDPVVYEKAQNMVVVYEGLHTYGGMAGRDMEALAIGITESVQDDHIRARVGQVHYLGKKLEKKGIPIVKPIGTHGVFIDAKKSYNFV